MLAKSLAFYALAVGALHGAVSSSQPQSSPQSQPQPESYDGDLFNKDKQCWFASAEFLYWLVNEGALDYALSMNQAAIASETSGIGKYKNARFDWNPGLRVSIGFFRAPHFWDAFLQYTFLPAAGTNTAHPPKGTGLFLSPTFLDPINLSSVVQRAKSRINLQYHLVDFLFSRRFHTNEHLRINVFGGPTAAFLYQSWKVTYDENVGGPLFVRNRWQFQGVGLRLGLKFDWYLGCDLYLTGLVSNGLLSGWYKNSAFESTVSATGGSGGSGPVAMDPPLIIRDTHFKDLRLTYTAQFLAGPSWQKRFDSVRTELFAGYEFTIWTNLHQIYRSFFAPTGNVGKDTLINDSNVSLQGLTVRSTIDF